MKKIAYHSAKQIKRIAKELDVFPSCINSIEFNEHKNAYMIYCREKTYKKLTVEKGFRYLEKAKYEKCLK